MLRRSEIKMDALWSLNVGAPVTIHLGNRKWADATACAPQLPDVPNLFRNRHVDAATVLVDLCVVERVVDELLLPHHRLFPAHLGGVSRHLAADHLPECKRAPLRHGL